MLDGSVSFIFGTSWNPCLFGNDRFATSAACVKECFAKNWTKHSQVHEAFRSGRRGVSMENALLGGFKYLFFFFFWEMVQFDKHWYFAGELKLSTGLILGIDDEVWWFKEFGSDEMSFIWAQLEKWQIYSNLQKHSHHFVDSRVHFHLAVRKLWSLKLFRNSNQDGEKMVLLVPWSIAPFWQNGKTRLLASEFVVMQAQMQAQPTWFQANQCAMCALIGWNDLLVIHPFFGERHPSVPMCMGFVKGSLDEKLPSYEVFKMRRE